MNELFCRRSRELFEHASWRVVASFVVLVVMTMGATGLAQGQGAEGNDEALVAGPTLRGKGKELEMLVRGRVLDADGAPAKAFELEAKIYKNRFGRDALPAKVEGNAFETWVPIGDSTWFCLNLTATAKDGSSRAFKGIGNRGLRQAAIDGVDLKLAATSRPVEVIVTHRGQPVADAHVHAQLNGNLVVNARTGPNGKAKLRLCEGEELVQLTAWTDDYRVGGYSFNRKPHRDPRGGEFAIELDDCREQKIRFVDADNQSPVANVPFEFFISTGEPHYNFPWRSSTFSHARMTTDAKGEALLRWLPEWEKYWSYVELDDPGWYPLDDNRELKTGDDGVVAMTLKRATARKPLAGKVSSDRFAVGGLLVEINTFQAEREDYIDMVYAYTDETGAFTAECLPGATYTVCVNDRLLTSEIIDLMPYDPLTRVSKSIELSVGKGNPVEIRVTSGARREPMENQWVNVNEIHYYSWQEDGETRYGQGSRNLSDWTDANGVIRGHARAGAQLEARVFAGDWRSEDHKVTVGTNGVTRIEIHREVDVDREVTGRLLAPEGIEVDLADAEIHYGAIDGQFDERETVATDAEGRFAFKTKAIELGIFAYTADGKAAGVLRTANLDEPIDLRLKPTIDLHGRLIGPDGPLAKHAVRVNARVEGKQNFDTSFATSFATKTFETQTDAGGNYTLANLPAELDMTLQADPIDGAGSDVRLDDFYLAPGEERPRMVSRLGGARKPDNRTLAEKHDGAVRDAKLGAFHVLVLRYDDSAKALVDRILDYEAHRDVMSYINLLVKEDSLTRTVDRDFVEARNWPKPPEGKVFACALDAAGEELGRIELDAASGEATKQIDDFLRAHAPPQQDARAKWDAAFAEAKRTDRRVWARISQRYCGPCFRLSRWLDDHHEVLERDYVMLKIDDARDKNGVEIAQRILHNRGHQGIPFCTIFDANEQVLIDSVSPVGNFGYPSSFEGQRHLKKMLHETSTRLTDAEIDALVDTLSE